MDTDQVVLKGLFLSGASCRQHQLSNQPQKKKRGHVYCDV